MSPYSKDALRHFFFFLAAFLVAVFFAAFFFAFIVSVLQ
jgi:hypothetical protein